MLSRFHKKGDKQKQVQMADGAQNLKDKTNIWKIISEGVQMNLVYGRI